MLPFKFKENRVWRVYQGGAMIDHLRNSQNPEDNSFPEDWVASTVLANNPQRNVPGEGISTAVIGEEEITFNELINLNPQELLGSAHLEKFGKNLGFLTKILDSAIRLPIQAHPDREASARIYNSAYGKTETWIVFGTREINGEKPYLMLGFNEKLDKEIFINEALSGKMVKGLDMVHKHEVKAGDVLLLTGGTVHAIGPGVFLIEIMEPTDLVVQPELYCGTQKLDILERFGSVAPKQAMEIFHYTPKSKQVAWRDAAMVPETIEKNDKFELIRLLDREKVKFFWAEKLNLKKCWNWENSENVFVVGITCNGKATLVKDDYQLELCSGDTFFLPFSLKNCEFRGSGEIIFALPPV